MQDHVPRPDDDPEVPGRDRHEQLLPPPPEDRDPDGLELEVDEADQLDQATPIRGGDGVGRIEPGDETDGGI